jgi:hypothetical protein
VRTPAKLGAYALALAGVFAAAAGAGHVAGPDRAGFDRARPGPVAVDETHADGAAHDEPGADAADHLPGGLQVSDGGYRLAPSTATLATDRTRPFRFRILGPDAAPLRRYTTEHDRDLHLIVVRRDLTGFQHVHPELAADGTWSVPLAVGAPGQYRVFADFRPEGRADGLTLGVDVPAPGDYRPVALPPPARTATVDGYTVTLTGDLTPGVASRLTLSVSRDGAPVTDLQPYLGAYGHLVVLRDGDLAYLHVHPDGAPADGRTAAGPGVAFVAEVPSAGAYRLFLDFRHAGTVRTAAFTAVAGAPAPPAGAVPSPTASGAHGADGHTHG